MLVKVVPDRETLRFDPTRLTALREQGEQVLNPFDQRALRVALELRRPGEEVGVLSLGPPSALARLREARAVGAGTVRLLSHRAFAGSDVLATARALAAGLAGLGHDLVLAGSRSTDSDTGLVGPEVATLLGVPVVTEARSIRRDDDGLGLEVTVDVPGGWRTVHVGLPAVVTVGEKIAKPLRPDPERLARPQELPVEVAGLAAVNLDPALVGSQGSPSVVEAVHESSPSRGCRLFAEGPIDQRVDAAVEALGPMLGRPPEMPGPLPSPPERSPTGEIALVASDEDGRLDEGALGWFSEVRRTLHEHWPSALWLGPPPAEEEAARLAAAGALVGYRVEPGSSSWDSGWAALGVGKVLDARPELAGLLTTAEPFGREIAGQLAASRGLGAVGDATQLVEGEPRRLAFVKPSFGGRTLATIRSRTRPAVATVRSGLYPAAETTGPAPALPWSRVEASPPVVRVQRLGEGRDATPYPSPEGRAVVVAVGMGIGGAEGIASLLPVLRRWDAALVGTRRVVDEGWLPSSLQVGLTGRALAPRLAVLLGVRGSSHHMVGWRRARAILAVNAEPSAPVFAEADVGVVGRIDETLPRLVEPLAAALGR